MKNKIIRILVIIFMIVCLCGIVYYCYNIITWKKDLNENKEIHEEINNLVIIEPDDDTTSKYKINFDSLKKKNSDTVAYLNVKNTSISHVVVKGKDNDYYLHHNFNKKWSTAGWVFADYHNKYDGTDKNLVIYGHSMRNGSMFGTLRNVVKKTWYENKDNYIIDLVTPDGEFTYKVFSVYVIKSEDYYINTKFKDNNEFDKFVKTLTKRSRYNFNVKVDGKNQILTLSSCYDNNDRRVVLHAVLVK